MKIKQWWCRLSMSISATNTDDAGAKLDEIAPRLAAEIASGLAIDAKDVSIDHCVIIPYMEPVGAGKKGAGEC